MNRRVLAVLCFTFLAVCCSVALAEPVLLAGKSIQNADVLTLPPQTASPINDDFRRLQNSGAGTESEGNLSLGMSSAPNLSVRNASYQSSAMLLDASPRVPSPEPGSFLLLGTGFLAGAVLLRTRSRKKV